jgi:metal-dependent amidase/aminoacylase/carboxypeptidase family protein
MDRLSGLVLQIIQDACDKEGIQSTVNFHEEFPVTKNSRDEADLIERVALRNSFKVRHLDEPFKWSEDFGHFTNISAGAIFGLGSGENTAALHNPEFDFPDELIMTGVLMFKGIYEELLNHN